MMAEMVSWVTLGLLLGVSATLWLTASPDDAKANPYARMLGRTVLVKKHDASEWEPCVVVAVSWKGALRVRRLSEMSDVGHGNGFWIRKELAPYRVREVGE